MLLQETQKTTTWQGLIILMLFLAAFAYLGWKRGYRRELVALAAIFLGHRIWTGNLGDKFVDLVNRFYLMGRIALEARFNLARMMELAQNIDQMGELITPERKEPVLFFTFLGLVLLGYGIGHMKCCLGNLLKKVLDAPPSLVGGLFGALNGYLIVIWLFPTLFSVLPGAEVGRPVAARGAGQAAQATTRDVLAKGVEELAALFGLEPAQLLVVVVGLIVLWIAWRSR